MDEKHKRIQNVSIGIGPQVPGREAFFSPIKNTNLNENWTIVLEFNKKN